MVKKRMIIKIYFPLAEVWEIVPRHIYVKLFRIMVLTMESMEVEEK